MSTDVTLQPADRDPLYQRICAFDIDEAPTAHGFASRPANENGWFGEDGHARRVHTRRCWVIPRPGPWLSRHRDRIAAAGLLVATCMLLLGCDRATTYGLRGFLVPLALLGMLLLFIYAFYAAYRSRRRWSKPDMYNAADHSISSSSSSDYDGGGWGSSGYGGGDCDGGGSGGWGGGDGGCDS
jgi:hypothetical protein